MKELSIEELLKVKAHYLSELERTNVVCGGCTTQEMSNKIIRWREGIEQIDVYLDNRLGETLGRTIKVDSKLIKALTGCED